MSPDAPGGRGGSRPHWWRGSHDGRRANRLEPGGGAATRMYTLSVACKNTSNVRLDLLLTLFLLHHQFRPLPISESPDRILDDRGQMVC